MSAGMLPCMQLTQCPNWPILSLSYPSPYHPFTPWASKIDLSKVQLRVGIALLSPGLHSYSTNLTKTTHIHHIWSTLLCISRQGQIHGKRCNLPRGNVRPVRLLHWDAWNSYTSTAITAQTAKQAGAFRLPWYASVSVLPNTCLCAGPTGLEFRGI
jgi:hypothetical protein